MIFVTLTLNDNEWERVRGVAMNYWEGAAFSGLASTIANSLIHLRLKLRKVPST